MVSLAKRCFQLIFCHHSLKKSFALRDHKVMLDFSLKIAFLINESWKLTKNSHSRFFTIGTYIILLSCLYFDMDFFSASCCCYVSILLCKNSFYLRDQTVKTYGISFQMTQIDNLFRKQRENCHFFCLSLQKKVTFFSKINILYWK